MRRLPFHSARCVCGLLMTCQFGLQAVYANRFPERLGGGSVVHPLVSDILQEAPTHKSIVTTIFWVGEMAKPRSGWSDNLDSAWDRRWKENFGGLDSPIYRRGFFPARFQPKQNPFYVALPFNDINHPEYLDVCPILQSFKLRKASRTSSVCKNRWIEISYNGRSCFAQWQDVGPVFTDDYDYVFRGETPRAHGREMAGLDVSPAVRDFLHLRTTCRTNWRFVDDADVPTGPWKEVVTRY